MSIEYDGYYASTGFLTKLTNVIDRRKYTVSTVPKMKLGEYKLWEVATFTRGFFFSNTSRPLFFIPNVGAENEEQIRKIHHSVKE